MSMSNNMYMYMSISMCHVDKPMSHSQTNDSIC